MDWTFTNRFAPIGAVPEPASMALVGLGLAAGVMHRRRKRNAA